MKQTVDYGIDLGTTNSVIARMGKNGPKPIETRNGPFTLPSAVGQDDKGRIIVGHDALLKDTFE